MPATEPIYQLRPGTTEHIHILDWPKEANFDTSLSVAMGEGDSPSTSWDKERQPHEESALGTAIPSIVELGGLLDDRLKLTASLTLHIEQEGDFFIAHCPDIDEFGYGYDPVEAIDDFRQTVAELYWSLKEERSRLGADLASLWQTLCQLIHEA